MAGKVAFVALSSLFAAEGHHVAAVTAPVGAHVGEWLESVGNAVVDLLFVRV